MVTFGTTAAVHYKIAQQATLLSQTFQLRPANAASIIHCKEDHDFLQSMTGDRKASFAVFDQALLDRVQNNDTCVTRLHKRKHSLMQTAALQLAMMERVMTGDGRWPSRLFPRAECLTFVVSDADRCATLPTRQRPAYRSHHRRANSQLA